MRRVIGAAKAMLRQMLRPRAVKRADEALQRADANLVAIDRLAAREATGVAALRDQIRRLQDILREGRR